MIATLMERPSCFRVASSWIFIWIPPSPATTQTGVPGIPILTPIAAGRAKPMVPSPPEVIWLLGRGHGQWGGGPLSCGPPTWAMQAPPLAFAQVVSLILIRSGEDRAPGVGATRAATLASQCGKYV